MDYEAEVARGTERALFLLSEKRGEAVFNDLLAYATDACLVHPPEYLAPTETSKYDDLSPEDKLVQRIGARSLATLLEMSDGLHGAIQDDSAKFHVSELLTAPRGFSDIANNRVLENAERFGQALINESFAILGKDAPLWVEKLQAAKTEDEEMAVINWLDHRIYSISNRGRSESSAEDEKEHFYPPYRISPKFTGNYPDIDVQPSCLSASIMATSFFQKAGKPTLHAGVTTPAHETGADLLVGMIQYISNRDKDTLYQGADIQAETLIPLARSSQVWRQRPLAQHGAVYTKLSSGWVQFDAYNNATGRLFREENEHLNALYEKLTTWKDIVPNLEFSTAPLPNRDMQLVGVESGPLSFTLASFEYEDTAGLISRIDEALKTIPEESYNRYLYETCLMPLIDIQHFKSQNDEQKVSSLHVLEEAQQYTLQENGQYDSRMQRIFDKALQEFIRWKDTPEQFIERCATDPHYRARRAEDFLIIPSMMAVFNAQLSAQKDLGYGHLAVDIGNPAMRIGLTTLGDFARYDGHPLPAWFWITHQAGSVPIIENIDNPSSSLYDRAVLFNSLLWQQSHPFTSRHNYDKITSFLLDNRKDLSDGDEQE